jgi:hypothetical protein
MAKKVFGVIGASVSFLSLVSSVIIYKKIKQCNIKKSATDSIVTKIKLEGMVSENTEIVEVLKKKQIQIISNNYKETTRYFVGLCKFGHADSKNFYIKKYLYVSAENVKGAAVKFRMVPRVKHDASDYLLELKEIDRAQYLLGLKQNREDPFFKCKTIQEQRVCCPEIFDLRIPEDEVVSWKKGRHSLRRNFFDNQNYKNYTIEEVLEV